MTSLETETHCVGSYSSNDGSFKNPILVLNELNDIIMNNLFQVFCVLTSFIPWLYKILSFAIFIFIPRPLSPFHEQLQ